jgi:hypothetical protein
MAIDFLKKDLACEVDKNKFMFHLIDKLLGNRITRESIQQTIAMGGGANCGTYPQVVNDSKTTESA